MIAFGTKLDHIREAVVLADLQVFPKNILNNY
jgi:hypothetical protein